MQAAKDRVGPDRVRFSTAMARIWMWVVGSGERRIVDTGTQRHMRPAIGLCGGDFNTFAPSRPIDLSR